MKFDKSKVYTALNADELKVGSKVICGFSMFQLKERVEEGEQITEVDGIRAEDCEQRIRAYYRDGYFNYPLAYLISEPEEKKLKWTDLKIGDVIKCKTETRMVTGIDTSYESDEDGDVCHICAGGWWSTDKELEEWEKVE